MARKNSSLFILLGPLLFIFFLFLPTGLTAQQHHLAAVMLWVITWWLDPIVPLPVTGLLGVSLTVLMGTSTWSNALKGFSNPVIFLFLGGFLLAESLKVQKLDLWISARCLSLKIIGGRPSRVMVAITLMAACFSMVISNTATTAMFIPIALSVFTQLHVEKGHSSFKLLLMVGYAATIGGLGTPIGSPPNLIGLALLESMAGIKISFFEWMMKMLPLVALALLALFMLFWKELKLLPEASHSFERPAPMEKGQRRLCLLFLVTVFLWLLPGSVHLILGPDHDFSRLLQVRLPESVVAVFMGCLLFMWPNGKGRKLLAWEEAQHIDWGTLLLFGSGISLGQMMFDSGLTQVLGAQLPFMAVSLSMALFMLICVTLFSTELVSNTAAANLLIPLVMSTLPFKDSPTVPVLCIAAASSLAFMLPVGTPPNAIIYGSHQVQLSWMIKKGLCLNLVCLVLVWLIGRWSF